MIKKKNAVVLVLILLVCLVPTFRCNFLVRFAPTLLQGAAAMAIKGEAVIITRKGMRIRLTKNLKLTADVLLMPGSRLITGPNSSVDLVFTDSIKMRIGARTSVTLDMARLLEKVNFTDITMQITRGRVFATMKKLAKNSRFSIKTLRSIVQVRGTDFLVEETGNSNSIIVSDGKVALSSRSGNHLAFVDEGKNAAISQSGTVAINDINSTQEELINTMSSNIAELSTSDKKRIRDIVENHEENRRLIKEAYNAHKELINGTVSNQKNSDMKNVAEQKRIDADTIKKTRSAAADAVRKARKDSRI